MANNIIRRKWNQNTMVSIEDLSGSAFQAESGGHTFEISGVDNYGNTVALSGTVAGVFMRSDNTDVAITGTASGGVVTITLPAECYDVPGRFGLTVFVTADSKKTAIYAAIGTVRRTSSGSVAPGTTADVVDLINAINAAVATIPQSWTGLMADIAPTYSDSALYSIGQYAWYDGDLKRCIVPITTAESYTAAHWTSAVLGQDVSDLKSAIEELGAFEDQMNSVTLTIHNDGYYNASGTFVSENSRAYAIIDGVSAGEKYLLSTELGSGLIPAILYFNGNTFLSYEKRGTGSVETVTDYAFIIPTSCTKLIVQSARQAYPPTLTKVNEVLIPDFYTKEHMDGILGTITGKNLINPDALTDGYLNASGAIVGAGTGWYTTDYIDVTGISAVSVSVKDGNARKVQPLFFLCTYGSSKNFISQVGSQVASPYTVGSGVSYIRFSYKPSTAIEIQAESGTSFTAYEPYHTYNIVKDSPYVEEGDAIDNHFKNMRWAVFGDSLTEKNAKAEKSYYDWISDEFGCAVINYGKSGTGYAKNSSGTDNFNARMANINPDAFDVLTIFGSFNDLSSGLPIGTVTDTDSTTICGCINQTLDTFYSVAPYKILGLATPSPWASVPPDSANGNAYVDALLGIAKRRGIPIIDLYHESGLRPWSGADYIAMYYTENGVTDIGAHPNSLGHKTFLAPHFREFIKTLYY